MRIELLRDDSGIVCPMLEDMTISHVKMIQRARTIRGSPCVKNHMMRTRHGIDRVNLNEAELIDYLFEVVAASIARWCLREAVPIQKESPC